MRKLSFTLGVTLLLGATLTACGTPQEMSETPAATPTTTEEKVASEVANTESKESSTFDAGVHVNWEAVSSPLWNEDIENKLKTTLEAINDKDIKKLNESISPEASGTYDFMIQDNEYNFKKVSKVEQDNERVIVVIDQEIKFPNGEIDKDSRNEYYFEKDENDQWQLVTID